MDIPTIYELTDSDAYSEDEYNRKNKETIPEQVEKKQQKKEQKSTLDKLFFKKSKRLNYGKCSFEYKDPLNIEMNALKVQFQQYQSRYKPKLLTQIHEFKAMGRQLRALLALVTPSTEDGQAIQLKIHIVLNKNSKHIQFLNSQLKELLKMKKTVRKLIKKGFQNDFQFGKKKVQVQPSKIDQSKIVLQSAVDEDKLDMLEADEFYFSQSQDDLKSETLSEDDRKTVEWKENEMKQDQVKEDELEEGQIREDQANQEKVVEFAEKAEDPSEEKAEE